MPGLQVGLTEPASGGCVPIRANRDARDGELPAAPGDTVFRAFKLDVIRFEGGLVAEITTFGAALFPDFGLPPTL